MTSRRPEPFDEIAKQVSQEKAADFHERWVLGYGHASVAEHAVLHIAAENISRLACDTLEDNRLGSYTEKSSRYQVLPSGYYHVPQELDQDAPMAEAFRRTCDGLFTAYEEMLTGVSEHLKKDRPPKPDERPGAYNLRIRREAIDSCRFLLPAATLTNVGVTMNARSMEHAITKLLSSELSEERTLGEEIKRRGQEITPTLIKYAQPNEYMASSRGRQQEESGGLEDGPLPLEVDARLVHYDAQADLKLASALLFRYSASSYEEARRRAEDMGHDGRGRVIAAALEGLGPHDSPPREFETVDYTFEMVMDYGAYREFKRHRMQSYIPQPLTVAHGALTPELIEQAGLSNEFSEVMEVSESGFWKLGRAYPLLAPYLVTHAHKRRVLTKMNLRECYHLFKLRTQRQAHFSIRLVMDKALHEAVKVHPNLFRHMPLRDFPDWWPFGAKS
jgi:thymidylate synthase ThyX